MADELKLNIEKLNAGQLVFEYYECVYDENDQLVANKACYTDPANNNQGICFWYDV